MTETIDQGIDAPKRLQDRLAIAERALPRRRFFSDMPDKGLFAAFALLGFMAIMLLKVYGIVGTELLAGLAVFVMVLYGVLSFQLPAVQLRPDRLGDNFYYLGFIYTLASLSAALLQLRYSPEIEALLGNFGIALVTTVVGVAGRVLFVQMRADIDDVEERVRRDLVAASSDLRSQLVTALIEFETFHTGVLQATGEALLKTSRHIEAQIGQIGTAADAAAQRVDASVNASDARTAQLAEILQKLSQAIGELPLMSNMELPNERLEKQLMSFTSELESLIMELRDSAARVRRRVERRRRWYWPFRRRVKK